MSGFQRVVVMGTVGRDAELKFTQGGMAISKFSIAVSERAKVQGDWTEVTEWFNCTFFGVRAEKLNEHILKGKSVLVEGKLRTNKWEDKEGNKRSSTDLIVDNFAFAGKSGGGGQQRGPARAQEDFGDIPF